MSSLFNNLMESLKQALEELRNPKTVGPIKPPGDAPVHSHRINDEGLALIKQFEGCILTAYPDPASPLGRRCTAENLKITSYKKVPDWAAISGAPWTIGYGDTGPGVVEGLTISTEEALTRLKVRLEKEFEPQVRGLTKGFTSNEFSALVSFTYNCGVGNTQKLLKNATASGSDNIKQSIADKMLDFNKASGKVMLGLTRRRQAERELFLKKDK